MKRYETEPPVTRLVTPWAFAIAYLDWENRGLGVPARRDPGKKGQPRQKNMKMLDGVNILEVEEDPEDQKCVEADAGGA